MGSFCKGNNSTTVQLPEWVESQAKTNNQLANDIASKPYQTYSNQRLADFSGDQTKAFDMARSSAGRYSGGVDSALSSLAGVAGTAVPQIGGPPNVDAGMRARGGDIGAKFNPRARQTAGYGAQGVERLQAQDRFMGETGIPSGDINELVNLINGSGGNGGAPAGAAGDFLRQLGSGGPQGINMPSGFAGPGMGAGGPAVGPGGPPRTGGGSPYEGGGVYLPPPSPGPSSPLGQAQAQTATADVALADTALTDIGSLERVQADKFYEAPIDRYMNPYVASALDPALAEIRRQGDIRQVGNMTRATANGAFGGSRSGILEGETERGIMDALARTAATGYSDAFDKASTLVAADQGRDLTAGLANQGATNTAILGNTAAQNQGNQFNASALNQGGQFNANALNQGSQFNAGLQQQSALANLQAQLTGRAQTIDASRAQGDLSRLGQSMNYTDIAALQDIGKQQQGMNQSNMDLAYQDFLAEQNYPQEQLNMLISALNQTPYSRTTYGPQASGMGQGIGALLSLAGLFGKM